jgi:hypothetical protein
MIMHSDWPYASCLTYLVCCLDFVYYKIWGSYSGEYEDGCLWVVALCSLVEVHWCFRGTCCLHHCPDDGGSKYLWNVSKLLPDSMVLQRRRQSSSSLFTIVLLSPAWIEQQIYQNFIWHLGLEIPLPVIIGWVYGSTMCSVSKSWSSNELEDETVVLCINLQCNIRTVT